MGSSRFNVSDTVMSLDDIKHYKTIKKNVMRGISMIEFPTIESADLMEDTFGKSKLNIKSSRIYQTIN